MQLEISVKTPSAAAGCRRCGRVFTSVSAFDAHQRFTRQGLICLDPADVRLERKPNGRYGWKAPAVQPPQFNSTPHFSEAFTGGLVSSDREAS